MATQGMNWLYEMLQADPDLAVKLGLPASPDMAQPTVPGGGRMPVPGASLPQPPMMASPNAMQEGPPIQGPPVRPQEVARQQPGIWGRLKAGLPNMITAGIAAGAMPSVAGGGALDIFRAMQTGQEAVQKKDLLAYNQARQSKDDYWKQLEAESQIEQRKNQAKMNDATAEYYKAQARRWDAEAGKADKVDDIQDLYNNYKSNPTPENWRKYMDSKRGEQRPDPDAIVTIPGVGVVNTKTKEVIVNVPELQRKARLKAVGDSLTPRFKAPGETERTPWNEEEINQRASPAQKLFIETGQIPKQDMATSDVELAQQARPNDPEGALNLLSQHKKNASRDPGNARNELSSAQRASILGQGHRTSQTMYVAALNRFNADKAKLITPDSIVEGRKVLDRNRWPNTPEGEAEYKRRAEPIWNEYNRRHAELLQQLNEAKNSAKGIREQAEMQVNPDYRPAPDYGVADPSGNLPPLDPTTIKKTPLQRPGARRLFDGQGGYSQRYGSVFNR